MIGEEVRRRRDAAGLTGAQLAARAGLAPSAVSQIETGKRTPSSASVIKLAAALGVEVGDLYPKGQAPQPSLEDAAQSETFQEALAVLFEGLARRGQRIVEESRKRAASEALSRDAAEFQREGMMLGRLKRLEVGPSIYGRDTDELAEAEERYQEAAQSIQRLLEQDVDAPEMAREAGSFRRAREPEAKAAVHDLYHWVEGMTTEELKQMAREEARFAKPQTREEMVKGHGENKEAQLKEAHRRTMAFALIARINEVLDERGVRSPAELAIKQFNEVMGSPEETQQRSHEAHEGRETA